MAMEEVLESEMINGKLKILKEQSVLPNAYEGDPQLGMALIFGLLGFGFILLLERLADQKSN